jgi:hypothetical protein
MREVSAARRAVASVPFLRWSGWPSRPLMDLTILHCLIYLSASAMPRDPCERERNGKAPEKGVCGEEYRCPWLRNLTAGKPQQRMQENRCQCPSVTISLGVVLRPFFRKATLNTPWSRKSLS